MQIKESNGKKVLAISKMEWEKVGKENGWTKQASLSSEEFEDIKHVYDMTSSASSVIDGAIDVCKKSSVDCSEWEKELIRIYENILGVKRKMENAISVVTKNISGNM